MVTILVFGRAGSFGVWGGWGGDLGERAGRGPGRGARWGGCWGAGGWSSPGDGAGLGWLGRRPGVAVRSAAQPGGALVGFLGGAWLVVAGAGVGFGLDR